MKYEGNIAMAAWLASLVGLYLVVIYAMQGYVAPSEAVLLLVSSLGVGLATTFNLRHHRNIVYDHGSKFADRAHAVLADELRAYDARMIAMERDVADVKEAQVRIAGQFRGNRQHP